MYKKGSKRFLTLLIAVLILSLSFTGCGKEADTNVQSQMTPTSVSTPQKETPPVTLKYFTVMHDNWQITDDTPVLKEILKKTNVKIEYIAVPSSALQEKFNLTMASGALPDLFNLNITVINEYAAKGAFLELGPLVDKSAPNLKKIMTPEVLINVVTLDKKYYGIPRMNQPRFHYGWVIRKDWLDKLKLNEPSTLDEWVSVLTAFRDRDPDGNGKNDTIPFTIYGGVSNIKTVLNPAFGMGFSDWTENDNGTISLNCTTANYKKMLEWLNKLYKEKLLDQEFVVLSFANWQERLLNSASGSSHAFLGRSDMFTNDGVKLINTYKMIATAPPKGPDGKSGAPTYNPTLTPYSVAISKDCKNVDAAMRYLNYYFSDEGAELAAYGIDGVSSKTVSGKKEYTDEIKQNGTNYALHAKYGILQLMFPRRMTDGEVELTLGPLTKEAISKNEKFYVNPLPVLSFTKEEQDKIKEIGTNIQTAIKENSDKFVTGDMALTQWDDFQAQLKKLGVDEYIKINNDAYKRYLELKKTLK